LRNWVVTTTFKPDGIKLFGAIHYRGFQPWTGDEAGLNDSELNNRQIGSKLAQAVVKWLLIAPGVIGITIRAIGCTRNGWGGLAVVRIGA
jgi:hypothetical protein